MYKITEKVALNPTVTKMVIEAPLIAKKAKPGQFIIVRPFEDITPRWCSMQRRTSTSR